MRGGAGVLRGRGDPAAQGEEVRCQAFAARAAVVRLLEGAQPRPRPLADLAVLVL
jgi:hypothetical protein